MRPPPRILVAVATVVLAVTTVLAVLGALRTGVTTDEPIHVMRLRNYFDTGWYALDWDYSRAGPGGDGTNTYVYAPATMLLLHGWSVLWGVEGWHDVATTSRAYDVRHLGIVVIGLVGVLAVAVIGRVVLQSWRWGLVAAAVLAATPLWTGHEMFNVKDIPVATGHTLVTLGLLLHVRTAPGRWPVRLGRASCLVTGLVLTLGTRPGMWSGLSVVVAVAVLGVLAAPTTRRTAMITLAELAASCGLAAATLVAIYPNLFGSPLRALPRTSESSSSFLDGEKSDRLYVPRHIVEDLPTLLTAFALTGAVVVVAMLLRRWRSDPVAAARLALVGAQAFTLPVVAIVLGSDLYHGLRQLLFADPGARRAGGVRHGVVVGAAPRWWPARRSGGRTGTGTADSRPDHAPAVPDDLRQPRHRPLGRQSHRRHATGRGLLAREHPRAGRTHGARSSTALQGDDHQDTDLAFPFANGGEAFSTSRSTDCREEANGPLAPDRLPVVRQLPATEYDAVFIGPLPRNCTPLDDVSRWRHGFDVVMATLGRCTVEPAPLTLAGVRADDPVLATTLPGDLWLYATDGWLQWPGRAQLTARCPWPSSPSAPTRPAPRGAPW